MATNPRELYHKLEAIASNAAATDGERAQARMYMRRLVDRHGPEVTRWTCADFTPESASEQQLVVHAAATHRCKVRQEPPVIYVEGPTEHVERVKADVAAYTKTLADILQVTLIAAMKGLGVYCDDQGEHGGRTQEAKPAFPYDVQRDIQNLFKTAQTLGMRLRRPDYTLKQLPAPRPRWAKAPGDPTFTEDRMQRMRELMSSPQAFFENVFRYDK